MSTPILHALSTLGLAWTDELAVEHVDLAEQVHDSLTLGADGLWRSRNSDGVSATGLTLTEALGLTLVVLWAELDGREVGRFAQPVTLSPAHDRPGSREWTIRLPAVGRAHQRSAKAGIAVARALLFVRRMVWPVGPWRPKDIVAEGLELAVFAMEGELRGPAPVQHITPEVIASDLDRAWNR